MGALHKGHISLIHRALMECDRVAASVFVNPLQFNDKNDLARYPRQLERDRALLEGSGCHMLFAPTEAGIFGGFQPMEYEIGGLDRILEGAFRPGHFQGVLNAVERLCHFVRPDKAYFGLKDRQQFAVIRKVSEQLNWPVEVIGCPTIRDDDGLALSSRNQLLDAELRAEAMSLYKSLRAAEALAFKGDVREARKAGSMVLQATSGIKVDYFEITDPVTLHPLESWGAENDAVALVAASVGNVRLIDNLDLHR